jgi:Fic family protein
MTELARRPYKPFPAFAVWRATNFDRHSFDRFAGLLARSKKEADEETLRRAVRTATKWAAIDTGAIEGLYEVDRGFTFSVAVEAAAWDNIHLVKGELVQRAIHDAVAGYDSVLDLATGAQPITEVWIKQLHETICTSQETYAVVTAIGKQEHALEKGVYKSQPNSPFNIASNEVHEYAPVADTPMEMERLIGELRGADFESAHPVLQAAYAHYGIVSIHPFSDGNGRVARALASAYLYRSPGVPLVIFADQKGAYIDALEASDSGSHSPFVQFIADRAIDTVQMVRTEMRRRAGPALEERLAQLQTSLTGRGGLLHDEVDAIAQRLVEVVAAAFNRQLELHPLQLPLSMRVGIGYGAPVVLPQGYRHVPSNPRHVSVTVASNAPARGSETRPYGVSVSRPDHSGPDFVVTDANGRLLLEVFLREMHPTVSAALSYRAEAVAEDEVVAMVDAVVEQGQEALRQQGYLI